MSLSAAIGATVDALPNDQSLYFKNCLSFLKEYLPLFDFKLINYVDHMQLCLLGRPKGEGTAPFYKWLDCLSLLNPEQLNALPFTARNKEILSNDLSGFFSNCEQLSFDRELQAGNPFSSADSDSVSDGTGAKGMLFCLQNEHLEIKKLNRDQKRGMSPKKVHEVELMALAIFQVARSTDCYQVLDVGAGLGYLGQCLVQNYGLRVVCLENKTSHVKSAVDRMVRQDVTMETINFEIQDCEENFALLEDLLQQRFGHSKFCLVGLHCCGSLTSSLLKIYGSRSRFAALISIGCCYHGLQFTYGECKHFPMSKELKMAANEEGICISVYALRLAAQETRARWFQQSNEEHEQHSRHVFYRGLIELAARKGKIITPKKFPKLLPEFGEWIKGLGLKDFEVHCLLDLHDEHFKLKKYVEPLTCLQVALQSVLESLITADRLTFLKELGIVNTIVRPLFDEFQSPRNLAIISLKD